MMLRLARLVLTGFLAVAVLAACGGSDDRSNAADPSTTTAPDAAEPTDDSADDADTSTTTTVAEPETVGAGEGLIGLDLPAITVAESDPGPEGAGRPTLRWEAVEGAAAYIVNVRIGDDAHWGVTVTEPEATVGGAGLDPAAPGVRVSANMTWLVLALDAEGFPIAQSRLHPVPG